MKNKALPSIAISFIALMIIWLYNGAEFSIWIVVSILISSPILGLFAYSCIAEYVREKNAFINIICSFIAVITVLSILFLANRCGCFSDYYDEDQDRLMDRRMMLRN